MPDFPHDSTAVRDFRGRIEPRCGDDLPWLGCGSPFEPDTRVAGVFQVFDADVRPLARLESHLAAHFTGALEKGADGNAFVVHPQAAP